MGTFHIHWVVISLPRAVTVGYGRGWCGEVFHIYRVVSNLPGLELLDMVEGSEVGCFICTGLSVVYQD